MDSLRPEFVEYVKVAAYFNYLNGGNDAVENYYAAEKQIIAFEETPEVP